MALWTNSDAANGAPIMIGVAGVNSNTGSDMYGNTQIAAFNTNLRKTSGVFGVSTTEQTVSETSNTHPQHAGWVLVTRGTGPIISVTANTRAVATNGALTLTGGGTGAVQANVYISVNTHGHVINSAIQINEVNGFIGGNYLTVPAHGTAGNAVFTFTLGGRAGRSQTETLVAMGSLGNVNATGIATAVFVADIAADNTIFPNS
jgi:hypothetical protein